MQPERMDAPGLDPASHRAALRGLRRINSVSGVSRVMWNAIRQIAVRRGLERFSVLDVACGGGDLLASLARRARRAGIDIRFTGCDISPTAIEQARLAARSEGIRYFVADAVSDPPAERHDFVTSTLFLHHLERGPSVRLLANLRSIASGAVLLNDLVRGRAAHLLAWGGCRLLSRSPVVHFDGPASVLGAYTIDEARGIASEAGLEGARFVRHWPFRFLMEWEAPP